MDSPNDNRSPSSPESGDRQDNYDSTFLSDYSNAQPDFTYLQSDSQPLPLAPSTLATYMQASQPGHFQPSLPTTLEAVAVAGNELVRNCPPNLDFDKLEALESDYRAMMTYSLSSMFALAHQVSVTEVRSELLKSLAGYQNPVPASPGTAPTSPDRRT
ncbi:hypothetical protein IWQ62_006002 [Dispira parvispora]|uniref:Uncharacterized protein n=1 Tax=Dispira parvispora TaxID=1520584 RepID=A0A9W8AIW9_9FUNG|nr:hypothetical protein IWQ62_006002 [Dispira parvispora]